MTPTLLDAPQVKRPEQVAWAYADIEQKRLTTRYLHLHSQLIDDVPLGRVTEPTA